jgi:SPW repeat
VTSKRWQDWLLLLGGIWLFVAPWALGTSSDTSSSSNAWAIGALVAATAWWALARPADKGAAGLQGLYGAWLFITPWLLDFTAETTAAWNAWSLGAGIAVLAGWVMVEQGRIPAIRSSSVHDNMAHGSH